MFYVKTKISDNCEIKVDLYDDEIYTVCYKCGKEIQVERENLIDILKNGGYFASTTIACDKCSKNEKCDTTQKQKEVRRWKKT